MKKLLVDQVEKKILDFLLSHQYKIGDTIPTEKELATELGVARSVLREALRGFKNIGFITSRPRVGMILHEPIILTALGRLFDPRFFTHRTLLHMLEMRIIIEIGAMVHIVKNITEEDIDALEILQTSEQKGNNRSYPWIFEYEFHRKMYSYTNNDILIDFQSILFTAITYMHRENKDAIAEINRRLALKGITPCDHDDIIKTLRSHDSEKICQAITSHFMPYSIFIQEERIKGNI